jgi:hypothetical protein
MIRTITNLNNCGIASSSNNVMRDIAEVLILGAHIGPDMGIHSYNRCN